LEQEGWITAEWIDVRKGSPREILFAHALGRRQLEKEADNWAGFERYFAGYQTGRGVRSRGAKTEVDMRRSIAVHDPCAASLFRWTQADRNGTTELRDHSNLKTDHTSLRDDARRSEPPRGPTWWYRENQEKCATLAA